MKHECNLVSAICVKTVRFMVRLQCVCMLVHWFLFMVIGRFILILKFTVLSSGFIVRNAMVVHLSL